MGPSCMLPAVRLLWQRYHGAALIRPLRGRANVWPASVCTPMAEADGTVALVWRPLAGLRVHCACLMPRCWPTQLEPVAACANFKRTGDGVSSLPSYYHAVTCTDRHESSCARVTAVRAWSVLSPISPRAHTQACLSSTIHSSGLREHQGGAQTTRAC